MTSLAKVQARQEVARLCKGKQRLHARADFERVRREGRSWSHGLLVMMACPNASDGTRVGVAAGKRVGRAVVRNRAKRLMREAMRQFYPRIRAGWDLVLIARVAIVPVKMQTVAAALESLLRQAGLLPDLDDQAGSPFRQHTE
jgi:ribonuclease P protein component